MPNDSFFWAVDAALTEFEHSVPRRPVRMSKSLDILVVGEYLPDVINDNTLNDCVRRSYSRRDFVVWDEE